MSFREFVVCVALIQASIALAIDMMVPALGRMSVALNLGPSNARQWVITAFLLGFGAAQLFYGLVADRYGRRLVLLFSLAIYVLSSFAAAAAPDFAWLLAARVLQGVGGAGAQVVAISIIRDCYAGRRMAQVNSLSFVVFLAAPIFAPSIGQFVLLFAPWPTIFVLLGSYGALAMAWVAWRLPETQHAEDRRPITVHEIAAALRLTLTNRMSLGYTLASTLLLAGWLGFINSAQQVFAQVFFVPKLFPLIFAICSICMAVAALTNSQLVERLGMRRLSHAALLGFIAVSLAQAGLAMAGQDSLLRFSLLQSVMMFCFGLQMGNFNAVAMEPMGHIAGTAASVQGFMTTLGAAGLGFIIGQNFNGTLIPVNLGFCLCSSCGLVAVLAAERGALFRGKQVQF